MVRPELITRSGTRINFLLDATDPSRDGAPAYVLDGAHAPVAGSAFEDDAADAEKIISGATTE